MSEKTASSSGTPPKDQRIPIMMSAPEVATIDDWRFQHRVNSRSEAVRRLCQIGLSQNGSTLIEALEVISSATNLVTENYREAKKMDYRKDEEGYISKIVMISTHKEILDHLKRLIEILLGETLVRSIVYNEVDLDKVGLTAEGARNNPIEMTRSTIETLDKFIKDSSLGDDA